MQNLFYGSERVATILSINVTGITLQYTRKFATLPDDTILITDDGIVDTKINFIFRCTCD